MAIEQEVGCALVLTGVMILMLITDERTPLRAWAYLMLGIVQFCLVADLGVRGLFWWARLRGFL